MVSQTLIDPRGLQRPIDEKVQSIPPEVFLRREQALRFQRNGVIYATDGRVGTLKHVVVVPDAGEVSELAVTVEITGQTVVLPVELVAKTGGSAVFLAISRAQFAERADGAPTYAKRLFTKAGLRRLLKNGKRAEERRRCHAVVRAGTDFVETPIVSRLDKIGTRP